MPMNLFTCITLRGFGPGASAPGGLDVTSPLHTAAGPRLEVDGGTVEGARDASVESFMGIPFAAAPLGALRWRAPQPVVPWRGVRAATRFGADPMQAPFAEDLAPLQTTPAEDCLFVNVWRPAGTPAGAKLPLLVWLYGGGFVNGGSSPASYHGDTLARQGIVVASVNYRVGHFGFFAHPALSTADADAGLLGNYGPQWTSSPACAGCSATPACSAPMRATSR